MAHFAKVVGKIASEKGINLLSGNKKLNELQRQLEKKEIDLKQAIQQMDYWIDDIRLEFDRKDYERIEKEMNR